MFLLLISALRISKVLSNAFYDRLGIVLDAPDAEKVRGGDLAFSFLFQLDPGHIFEIQLGSEPRLLDHV